MRTGDLNLRLLPAGHTPTIMVSQDGTGDFDDTSTQAIKNAISRAQSKGIGTVLIKQGTYIHEDEEPIDLPAGMALKGIEPQAILKVDDEASPLQLIKAYDKSNIELKGLTLDGNKRCGYAVLDIRKTVEGQATENILLDNITVKGQLENSDYAWLIFVWDTQHENLLKNVRAYGCQFIDDYTFSTGTADSITFSFCDEVILSGCRTYGLMRPFQIYGCKHVSISGCILGKHGEYGLILQGTQSAALTGCTFYNDVVSTKTTQLLIRPVLGEEAVARDAIGITVDGCVFDGVSLEINRYSDRSILATQISNCVWRNIENLTQNTAALVIKKQSSGSGVLKWLKLSDLLFYHIGKENMEIKDCDRVDVENVRCITTDNTSWQTVYVENATNVHIKGLECVYEAGSYNHRALDVRNGSSVVVEGLHTEGYAGWGGDGVPVYQETDGLITFRGYNYICGKLTQNAGKATIPASSTSVVVSHGLYLTPTKFRLTPTANLGEVWVSGIGADQFTINCENAPASDTDVYWEVEV